MKRPSLQFYPADWRNNAKLRRCTFHLRGVWIETIGVFHDSDEYGVLRWPLREVAQAVGCKLSDLSALHAKGVLKGVESGPFDGFVYRPRHGRKVGDPINLIEPCEGPLYFSSRMVVDEHVRNARARHGVTGSPDYAPMEASKPSSKGGNGAAFVVPPTSSSSSSSKSNIKSFRRDEPDEPVGFVRFWQAYPATGRRVAKGKCLEVWNRRKLEPQAAPIIDHVEAMKRTPAWRPDERGRTFEPAPLTYLNQSRWKDGNPSVDDHVLDGPKPAAM